MEWKRGNWFSSEWAKLRGFCDVDVNLTTELLQYISRNRIDEKAIIEIIVTTMAMFNAILAEYLRLATPTKFSTNDLIKVPTTWDSTRVETKSRGNQGNSQWRLPKQHNFDGIVRKSKNSSKSTSRGAQPQWYCTSLRCLPGQRKL